LKRSFYPCSICKHRLSANFILSSEKAGVEASVVSVEALTLTESIRIAVGATITTKRHSITKLAF
uniref:CMP/dCMP-type deaminase domain-containing protein n=1 Tax=Haemonchus placei TaxID=6290 RepID=A0A0N4WC43_HAEPC